MRRIWIFSLILILGAVSVLSGCGSGKEAVKPDDKSTNLETTSVVYPAGQFPITNEKTTIKIMIKDPGDVENFDTNWFTKYLEQKTNVHIDWDIVDEKAAQEKLNLVLGSGDYPDVIMGFGVSNTQQLIYGKQGDFLPLNDMIEKYGTETKKMFETLPYVKDAITTTDGNIYALPMVNECYHCSMPQKMWINKVWLDKLGLKVPTTTDEFYEVLKAFKTKDPNGNNKADEIPMVGAKFGVSIFAEIDAFLMNAFIVNSGPKRLYISNNKVDVPYNKPEWKEGLAYLRKLYAEGLISPRSFTMDSMQYEKFGEPPGVERVGAGSGFVPGFTEVEGTSGRWLDYVTVPPLKGPMGVQVTPAAQSIRGGYYLITKASKHPEVAFRLADMLYNTEMTLTSIYGEKDKQWKWADASETGVNGEKAIWKVLANPSGAAVQNDSWGQIAPTLRTNELRLGRTTDPTKPSLESVLYKETNGNYEKYIQDAASIMPELYMTNEQASELADLEKTIVDYVNEMIVGFVTGDASLDKDWDSYIQTLDSMNLQRYLEIYQEAYDAKL